MPKKVSDEDRAEAKRLVSLGKSYREVSIALDGRVSSSWVADNARKEGWLRGILPEELVAEGQPQIFEPANATPEQREQNTAHISAAMNRRFAKRKLEIADELAEGILKLYGQMFEPCVIKEAKVVPGARGAGSEVQFISIPLPEPTPADKKNLAVALGILADKASLLAGDATSRVETSKLDGTAVAERLKHVRDEVADRRAQAEAAARQAKEAAG